MAHPKRPITANIKRLNRFMDQKKLAAVVVRSGQNLTYLSGIAYPSTHGRQLDLTDSPRGFLLVWPRKGEPVIIVNRTMERLTSRESWIERVEAYEPYAESPYSRLCKILKDIGLDREQVGIERDYVSAKHLEEVRNSLPQMKMVDCTAMMDEVRWIKTPEEIACFKEGADLLDDAFLDVFSSIRPGDTEREVHSRMIYSCLRRGVESAHGVLGSSTNDSESNGKEWGLHYDQYITNKLVFHKGDVIRTDYIAYVQGHGYPGHQSRNAVLGKPNAEQIRDYRIVRDAYRMGMDRCRHGAKACEVFETVVDNFKKHGWEFNPSFRMVGHSVGAWWHQQEPILSRDSSIVLEEGMVLALEVAKRYWHIQDLLVVRKDGSELISDKFSTDEIFIVE